MALAEPFQVNASTGAITVADADPLIVGHEWTVTVQVTDDATDTADDDWTVTLAEGIFAAALQPPFQLPRRPPLVAVPY